MQDAIANWRGLLSGSVIEGQQLLREVLEGPLKFEPDGKTYRFSAPVATGKLIADTVLPTVMASQGLPSWNQISAFLAAMRTLRDSGTWAA